MKQEQEESKDEYGQAFVEKWLKCIQCSEKQHESWLADGESVYDIYLSKGIATGTDGKTKGRSRFNMLWSNVQILQPALYSRLAKPAVKRKWLQQDPVSRVACMLAERCASYVLTKNRNQIHGSIADCVKDRLLPGRGEFRVQYRAEFGEPIVDPATKEPQLDEQGKPVQEVTDEWIDWPHIYWQDFRHDPKKQWNNVQWVAWKWRLSREDAEERFGGEVAGKLNYESEKGGEDDQDKHKACGWEIWDKKKKQVYWISETYKGAALKNVPDPLGLIGFFPCPKPLYATLGTDNLIPTPDYKYYEDLASDVEKITTRISRILGAIKAVYAYDASITNLLNDIADRTDGQGIPVQQWQRFVEGGGLKGVMDWLPTEQLANTVQTLLQIREGLIQQIYEVTGISDIIRGSTNPYETAAAQQLKGQFQTVRLSDKQADVQRFIRDGICLTVDMIFSTGPASFSDDTIRKIAGVDEGQEWLDSEGNDLVQQAIELLRNDRMRSFEVDIETDSTLAVDEEADKAARQELLGVMGNLFNQAFQISQLRPEILPLMLEAVLFAVRGHRAGRPLEARIEAVIAQIEQSDQAAAEQPPEPSIDEQKLQQQGQIAMAKLQFQGEKEMMKQQGQAEDRQIQMLLAENQRTIEELKLHTQAMMKRMELLFGAQMKEAEIRADWEQKAMDFADPARQQSEELKKQGEKTPATLINIQT